MIFYDDRDSDQNANSNSQSDAPTHNHTRVSTERAPAHERHDPTRENLGQPPIDLDWYWTDRDDDPDAQDLIVYQIGEPDRWIQWHEGTLMDAVDFLEVTEG